MTAQRQSLLLVALALALAGLLFGCAGSQAPTRAVAQAQSSIRAAEEMGAEEAPTAALHLKLAKDQLKAAEGKIAADENDDAALLLARANVDAELALAYARTEQMRVEAREAEKRVQELRR
jgi:hypothetical protein